MSYSIFLLLWLTVGWSSYLIELLVNNKKPSKTMFVASAICGLASLIAVTFYCIKKCYKGPNEY